MKTIRRYDSLFGMVSSFALWNYRNPQNMNAGDTPSSWISSRLQRLAILFIDKYYIWSRLKASRSSLLCLYHNILAERFTSLLSRWVYDFPLEMHWYQLILKVSHCSSHSTREQHSSRDDLVLPLAFSYGNYLEERRAARRIGKLSKNSKGVKR